MSRCHLSSHFSRNLKDLISLGSPWFMCLAVNVASCWVWRGFSETFSRIFFVSASKVCCVCLFDWLTDWLFLGSMASYMNVKSIWLTGDTRISVCDKISLGFSREFSDKWLHLPVGWSFMNGRRLIQLFFRW